MDIRWIVAIGFVVFTSTAVVIGVVLYALLESARDELKAIRNAVEEIREHSANLEEITAGLNLHCNYPEQEEGEII